MAQLHHSQPFSQPRACGRVWGHGGGPISTAPQNKPGLSQQRGSKHVMPGAFVSYGGYNKLPKLEWEMLKQ